MLWPGILGIRAKKKSEMWEESYVKRRSIMENFFKKQKYYSDYIWHVYRAECYATISNCIHVKC